MIIWTSHFDRCFLPPHARMWNIYLILCLILALNGFNHSVPGAGPVGAGNATGTVADTS